MLLDKGVTGAQGPPAPRASARGTVDEVRRRHPHVVAEDAERDIHHLAPTVADRLLERLDALLRETEGLPCPSPLLLNRLQALGVSKLGHRLQIQAALKEALKEDTVAAKLISGAM